MYTEISGYPLSRFSDNTNIIRKPILLLCSVSTQNFSWSSIHCFIVDVVYVFNFAFLVLHCTPLPMQVLAELEAVTYLYLFIFIFVTLGFSYSQRNTGSIKILNGFSFIFQLRSFHVILYLVAILYTSRAFSDFICSNFPNQIDLYGIMLSTFYSITNPMYIYMFIQFK